MTLAPGDGRSITVANSENRLPAGGNRGSKGQNLRKPNTAKNPAGHRSHDVGDERGPHGGSGGGQGNRQNRAVNRESKMSH
jgi:hypothetical protein